MEQFADIDERAPVALTSALRAVKLMVFFPRLTFILLGVYGRTQYFLLSSQLLLHCDVHFSFFL